MANNPGAVPRGRVPALPVGQNPVVAAAAGAGNAAGAPNAGHPLQPHVRILTDREERERLARMCADSEEYFRGLSDQMQRLIDQMRGLYNEMRDIVQYDEALRALQGAHGLVENIGAGRVRMQCQDALELARRVLGNPQIDDERRHQIQQSIDELEARLHRNVGQAPAMRQVHRNEEVDSASGDESDDESDEESSTSSSLVPLDESSDESSIEPDGVDNAASDIEIEEIETEGEENDDSSQVSDSSSSSEED